MKTTIELMVRFTMEVNCGDLPDYVDDLYIDVPSDKVTLHVDGELVKAKLVEFETMEVGPANA